MTKLRPSFNLAGLIWTDMTRHLGRVLLFLMVVTSAMAIILSAHHNRQLSIEQEKLLQERDQLDIEWRHLVLEQSTLTEHNRLESKVNDALSMRRTDPEEEVIVRLK